MWCAVAEVVEAPTGISITVDGRVLEAHKGELIISAAERAGTFIPRFCYHPRMKSVGMCRMCLVEVSGPRGREPPAGVLRGGGRRPGDLDQLRSGAQGPGGRARVLAPQPPLGLPRLRQGRRMPPAGPGRVARARGEPVRRRETALGQAHRDRPPRAARPRALHPVRAMHPFCGRSGGRAFHRLCRTWRSHRGGDLPRRALQVLFRGQHGSDMSGRRAHGGALPLQVPPVGPRAGRDYVHDLLGRLPHGRPVVGRRARPVSRRRLRTGEPELAV